MPKRKPMPQTTRRLWRVTRIVKEVYEVEADTRERALASAEDPHTVEVVRESCARSAARKKGPKS